MELRNGIAMSETSNRPSRGPAGNGRKVADRSVKAPQKASPDDDLNRAIINLLQRDGRMPFSEVAERLDVSEGTIRNRVAAMRQTGMLRIIAIADPVVAEYETDAMVGLKVAPGATPAQVAQRLGAVSSVVYILWVAGQFGLLIEVVTNDRDEFLEFLNNEIHDQPDIASAETMMGLKNFKNQFLLKSEWDETEG